MKLYAVHDKKAQALSVIHVNQGDTVASRGFADAVLQKDSVYGKYADDFELVCLADVSQEYQDLPEEMVANIQFRVVITAQQVLDAQPKSNQLELIKEA